MAGNNISEEDKQYLIKSGMVPPFYFSPYFVPETNNWHLKEGAPPEVVKEFNEYKRHKAEARAKGIIIN